MTKILDRTGIRYGRLIAVKIHPEKNAKGQILWECICDCGNKKIAVGSWLGNTTKSCGCWEKESRENSNRIHSETYYDSTGKRKVSKELTAWYKMKYRCYKKSDPKYAHYGERGIKVCERWLSSFENFLQDMGRAPSEKHSIDRINVNGDYTPENCRWADSFTQMNNTTRNSYLVLNGEKLTIKQWAGKLGIEYKYFHLRLTKNKTTLETEARKCGYIS